MNEAELICRAKYGDREALDELIEAYYDEVYTFLCRRMGDRSAAEDVTHDTFIKFMGSLSSYKEKNRLKSYLFAIAVNTSNDYFRMRKREAAVFCPGETEGEPGEDELEKRETAELVKQAVLELPEKQRDVIIMRFYHEMKLREIAGVQRVPVSTVKSRLRRAVKTLKERELK